MKWTKFLLLILFFQINLSGFSQGVDKYGRIIAGMQTLNQSQRDLVASPTAGLLIWCSNCAVRGELQVYNGISWTNTIGGSASNVFTAPIVTTNAVNTISNTSASSGGTITSNGGSVVTASGVCWSTSTNPTVSNNYTTGGTTSGGFTSTMTGTFIPGTTYYVRAFATNVVGTSYGNEVTFAYLPVGANYQGGTIFYLLVEGDAGYNPNIKHGLIRTAKRDYPILAATTWQRVKDVLLPNDNANNLFGYNDWRLPTIDEAMKICESGVIGNYDSVASSTDSVSSLPNHVQISSRGDTGSRCGLSNTSKTGAYTGTDTMLIREF